MWYDVTPGFLLQSIWQKNSTGMYYGTVERSDNDNNLAEAPKNPQQNLLNGRCFFESLPSDLDDAVSQHPRYLLYITIQNDLQFYEPFSCHRLCKDVAEKNRCDEKQHGELTTLRRNHQKPNSSNSSWFVFYCFFSRNESSFAVLSSWIGSPFFSRDGDVGCGKSCWNRPRMKYFF